MDKQEYIKAILDSYLLEKEKIIECMDCTNSHDNIRLYFDKLENVNSMIRHLRMIMD